MKYTTYPIGDFSLHSPIINVQFLIFIYKISKCFSKSFEQGKLFDELKFFEFSLDEKVCIVEVLL